MSEIDYAPLRTLLDDMESLLSDIFISGYSSVSDAVLKEMKRLKDTCESYGLDYPKGKLEQMYALIEEKRHSETQKDSEICMLLCTLNQYVKICLRQVDIDMAKQNLLNGGNLE